ncbi:PrsW family intramembrane metalloprotease [Actinomadura sp. NTSP31]|uniref:PrsW family intramembrane metalloprotease n=1 Tax=Actinomadura sp. NTSP31 TaxID=1735447 RepID=UPI0035C0FAD3
MARVDPKAVLEGRIPGRPPVGLIVGLTVSSLCVVLALAADVLSGGAGFWVGVVLAILPIPALVALALTLDRLEPEPPRALLFAFMWGAGVAVFGALVLNTLGLLYVTIPIFGEVKGHIVSATFGAPVIEESLKGAVLIGMLWFRRNEIDGFADGIIYAAMVGLGFAMMENITYYMRAFEDGGAQQLQAVFILRGLIAPLSHPLFTSMTGLGVAYAATHRRGQLLAPAAGLIGAMILHGLWNGATTFGLGGLGVVYLLDFGVLVTLIVIVTVERRHTVRRIEAYLPVYAGTGLVTPQDVRMLRSIPSRRAARRPRHGRLPARRDRAGAAAQARRPRQRRAALVRHPPRLPAGADVAGQAGVPAHAAAPRRARGRGAALGAAGPVRLPAAATARPVRAVTGGCVGGTGRRPYD